jgi:hypothetical protein
MTSDIIDIGAGVGDAACKGLMECLGVGADVVKDVPFVSSAIALVRAGGTVRDLLLTRKIKAFVDQVTDSIDPEFRRKFNLDLATKPEVRDRIAECLFHYLDSIDRREKATILAQVFGYLVRDELEVVDFDRVARGVLLMHYEDLLAWSKLGEGAASERVEVNEAACQAGFATPRAGGRGADILVNRARGDLQDHHARAFSRAPLIVNKDNSRPKKRVFTRRRCLSNAQGRRLSVVDTTEAQSGTMAHKRKNRVPNKGKCLGAARRRVVDHQGRSRREAGA